MQEYHSNLNAVHGSSKKKKKQQQHACIYVERSCPLIHVPEHSSEGQLCSAFFEPSYFLFEESYWTFSMEALRLFIRVFSYFHIYFGFRAQS